MGPFETLIAYSLYSMTQSGAYQFECGYIYNGTLVHEGTPMYGADWDGKAYKSIVVLNHNLTPVQKVQMFAHEWYHWARLNNGTFNKFNTYEEERLAYEYAADPANWDYGILRFKCAEEAPTAKISG